MKQEDQTGDLSHINDCEGSLLLQSIEDIERIDEVRAYDGNQQEKNKA